MAVERSFTAEGIRKMETNEYFEKRLGRAAYGGMEINRTPIATQMTVFAERPGMMIGRGGKTIKGITADLEDKFFNPQIDVQPVETPELNARVMAYTIANLLERGWHFRRAGYNTLHHIMDAGALGCEIVMSGKLTGTRSRTEKFLGGYIKHAGKSAETLVNRGFAIAKRKSGVLGVKVSIILPDAELPDDFNIKRRETDGNTQSG
jgi:small subunit ribosomal protein S3